MVERGPRLLAAEDEDVSSAVKEILEDEGVHVCAERGVPRAPAPTRDGLAVSLSAIAAIARPTARTCC